MAASYATYTDEHLEHWADIYQRERLLSLGIKFEIFLRYPREILKAMTERDFLPLLPEQVRVAARIANDDAMQELAEKEERRLEREHQPRCHNGHFIEPLHHRAYPRKKPQYVGR